MSPTTRKLRNRIDQNAPPRRLDRQISNPDPTHPTKKNPEKRIYPTNDDDEDDDKNYESSKESFATTTKEWKSYYQ